MGLFMADTSSPLHHTSLPADVLKICDRTNHDDDLSRSVNFSGWKLISLRFSSHLLLQAWRQFAVPLRA